MSACLSVSYQNPENPAFVRLYVLECPFELVRSFVRIYIPPVEEVRSIVRMCVPPFNFVRSLVCTSPPNLVRLSEARPKVSVVKQPTIGARI